MKILYISGAKGADYQCDLVFHGLRTILGPDLVDVQKIFFMYDTSPVYFFHTLYKKLPDIEVDRDDILAKIRSRYFDAVVYGSVHRNLDNYGLVSATYPRDKIAFIDGEDGPELIGGLEYGHYFKREIYELNGGLIPIQFGVPKECIRPIDLSRKKHLMAHCDPRDRSTMVYYDSEARYYDQYSDAFFGYTMKKGGWDCMRHHEILAAGCLPYFENFAACPQFTLARFHRKIFADAKALKDDMTEWRGNCKGIYEVMLQEMRRGLLTTEDLAKLILDRLI